MHMKMPRDPRSRSLPYVDPDVHSFGTIRFTKSLLAAGEERDELAPFVG
jgi:hypothetical protein